MFKHMIASLALLLVVSVVGTPSIKSFDSGCCDKTCVCHCGKPDCCKKHTDGKCGCCGSGCCTNGCCGK